MWGPQQYHGSRHQQQPQSHHGGPPPPPFSVLPHAAPPHVVEWRAGLPGVLPVLLTCCGTVGWMTALVCIYLIAPPRPAPPCRTRMTPHQLQLHITQKQDDRLHVWAEGKGGVGANAFGPWLAISPFTPAGGAVAWLRWANYGSTRASQVRQGACGWVCLVVVVAACVFAADCSRRYII